jgi:hypothetical protein
MNTEIIPVITKEEAKKQFDSMTEKLGIIHTFSFEEMYDWLIELRRRSLQSVFRSKITEFEKIVQGTPGSYGEDPFPLVHLFINGMYIRQVTVPAKVMTVTKIHAVEHIFFLQKGIISILTEDGVVIRTAPYQGVTRVGTKRVIFHHDEVIFTTVHPTKKTTVQEVEEEIFVKDFASLEIKKGE